MDKIICLVGPSGSGKTTIAKELEKEGYNVIQSYTTRKPRYEGEWGHIFVEDEVSKYFGFNEMKTTYLITKNGKLYKPMAFKKLYGEFYWFTKEQYIGKGTSIYIVDPEGAEQVQKNVTGAEVITVFIMADEEVRISRLQQRYWEGTNLKTAHELNAILYADKRIEKDREIFKTCKCDYAVDANRELKEVVEDIKEIIEEREN